VGYQQPTAFVQMFRNVLGTTPIATAWFISKGVCLSSFAALFDQLGN